MSQLLARNGPERVAGGKAVTAERLRRPFLTAQLPRNGSAMRPGSCRNRPRRCYGSGLTTGEDILFDDRVDAPISINHLGDAEVDANRN
jgi:hypothetical protein